MMNRPDYLMRCGEGAMLGIFLYRFTEETSYRRSKPFSFNAYVAKQEEMAARKLIWC